MSQSTNISNLEAFQAVIVGVGGQGVISATQMLAHAAMLENYNVRTAETHGMAQRGGSVTGYLRFGSQVEGSLVPKGGANVIMSFEPSEALRNRLYANSNTYVFINKNKITPLSVYQNRKITYPEIEEIEADLKKITSHVHFIDANQIALEAGNVKAINVVMIGFIYGLGKVPLKADNLMKAILRYVPPKALEVNKNAFELGMKYGQKLMEEE